MDNKYSKFVDTLVLFVMAFLLILLTLGVLPAVISTINTLNSTWALSYLSNNGYYCFAGIGTQISDDMIPSANNTYDLGSESNQWNEVYADTIVAPVGRTATYVIAPSDAPTHVIAQADYRCDGTDDDVQIQAAIDACTSGGSVYIVVGNYYYSTAPDISTANVTVFGHRGTILHPDDCNGFDITANDAVLTRIGIDGSTSSSSGHGISIGSGVNRAEVSFCEILYVRERGVLASSCIYPKILNNRIRGTYQDCIVLSSCSEPIVKDNLAGFVNSSVRTSEDALVVSSSSRAFIAGNYFDACRYGIYVYESDYCRIIGNHIEYMQQYGLQFTTGSDDNTVEANVFANNGKQTDNTYSSVLNNGRDRNKIIGNTCYWDTLGDGTHGTNREKYFIYIYDSTSGNCTVALNDVGASSAKTANIANSGTSTTIARNKGYITENSGSTAITNGNTAIAVTHGLDVTPDEYKVRLVPLEDPTNTPGAIGVSNNATSTQFWVFCENDPGASNLDIGWSYSHN